MNFSPRRQAALIIAAVFVLLGALAIYVGPISASSLETRLALAGQSALQRAGAENWARLEADGQVLIVSGQAPSRAARQEALQAVSRASWAGGTVAGGVTRVINETRLAYEGEDVRLAADLSNGRVSVTGFAPDAEAVERVRERAEQLFPGRADVALRIAPGSAATNWDRAVRLALAELARLDHGGARVADGRIALTGLASNTQTLDTVRAAFENPPQGFEAAALVRVDGAEFTREAAPNAVMCELLMDAALGQARVGFNPGRASLTSGSAGVLRRAGRVFATCEDEPLIVTVRAESDAAEAQALALERAEAIIAAMAEAGPARAAFLAESAPSDAASAFRLSLQARAETGSPNAADEAASDAEPGDETGDEAGAETNETTRDAGGD